MLSYKRAVSSHLYFWCRARALTACGAGWFLALGMAASACGSSGSDPSALPAAGASAGGTGNAGASGGGAAGAATPIGGASTGGPEADAGLAPGVGPCNVRTIESPPASAFHELECSDVVYSTNPPSGGDHYQVWAAFQSYDVPVPAGFLVHALEHGAVVFWYHCPEGCTDEVATVENFIAGLPEDPLCDGATAARRAVLVPYPELASRWAVSAWGHALTADCFDEGVFTDFYTAHVGRAPENFCNDGQTNVATRCP